MTYPVEPKLLDYIKSIPDTREGLDGIECIDEKAVIVTLHCDPSLDFIGIRRQYSNGLYCAIKTERCNLIDKHSKQSLNALRIECNKRVQNYKPDNKEVP